MRRRAVDHWHDWLANRGRLSLRRTAEFLRSWLGRQERWRSGGHWLRRRPAKPVIWPPVRCSAGAFGRAGVAAQASVPGPLQNMAQSAELGTAGLWARLRGGATRVVLLLADSGTGLLWPPVVAEREDQAAPWQRLFARARTGSTSAA